MTKKTAAQIEKSFYSLPNHKYFRIGFLAALTSEGHKFVYVERINALRMYADDGNELKD